jgi:Ca2+-binding EF-hand superfamily protein
MSEEVNNSRFITITDLYLANERVDPSQDERRGISKIKRSQLQTLLGKDPTIVAIIYGLKGELARYNGCIAQPQLTEREGYFILTKVSRFGRKNSMKESLVLVGKNLMATEANFGQAVDIPRPCSASSHQVTQGNRSDVSLTLLTLSAQIRAAVKNATHNGTTLRALFAKFDLDGNGTLSKSELKAGCLDLNIKLSDVEIELVWPYFDKDNSGSIDVDEFFGFAERPLANTPEFHLMQQMEDQRVRNCSRTQREKRIAVKTFHGEFLTQTLSKLHGSIKAWAERTGHSPETLFADIDEDHSGEIDVKEMHRGLRRAGITLNGEVVSQFNVKALWLVLTDGANDPVINLKLWTKFLKVSSISIKNRYKLTQDEFQYMFPDYVPASTLGTRGAPQKQKATKKKSKPKSYPWINKTEKGKGSENDLERESSATRGKQTKTKRPSVLLWEQNVLHGGTKKGGHNHVCRTHGRIAALMWRDALPKRKIYHSATNEVVDDCHGHPVHGVYKQPTSPIVAKSTADNAEVPLRPKPPESVQGRVQILHTSGATMVNGQPSRTPGEGGLSKGGWACPAVVKNDRRVAINARPARAEAKGTRAVSSAAPVQGQKKLTKAQEKSLGRLNEVREKQRALLASLESQRSRLNDLNGLMGVSRRNSQADKGDSEQRRGSPVLFRRISTSIDLLPTPQLQSPIRSCRQPDRARSTSDC